MGRGSARRRRPGGLYKRVRSRPLRGRARVFWRAFGVAAALAAATPALAHAEFPYRPQGAPDDYASYRLPPTAPVPNDLTGKRVWMYAATPEPDRSPLQPNPLRLDRRELNGVRGASLVDAARTAPQAWTLTTGRPDVSIAVLDSGIEWNDLAAMKDLRLKVRLSKGELPKPRADRAEPTDAASPPCATLRSRAGSWDLNGDGVFNVLDYACDARVDPAPPRGVGAVENGKPLLDPQDLLIAFSDGVDDDHNGYVDDIAGWDFLDDDNDPFDDVQYGHGTGEARDSTAEADNGGDLGTCPNCMVVPLRVGTSFIADVNRFALATIYATDNGVDVVQVALGTLNKSRFGDEAVRYAYEHGVTTILSAADEAAQHHNWPSSYPYAIVVNSVTHPDVADQAAYTSYLQFNGCTNFSSRITLAIPSVSCSSDATGRAAGIAGLVYSAALNAHEAGRLAPHPRCRRTDGRPCLVTPNEVRQLLASGTFGGEGAADDVNFAQDPVSGASIEPSCGGRTPPPPGCTDPFFPLTASPGLPPRLTTPPLSYPARKGHDQFYGYGRVNVERALRQLLPAGGGPSRLPPEVEISSPRWFEFVDPGADALVVRGTVAVRSGTVRCRVFVAPGAYPKDTEAPDGDFVEVGQGGPCDGATRDGSIEGVLATVPIARLRSLFPANAGDFRGPEGGTTGQTPNPGTPANVGRPNDEPYSFVVKVVAESTSGGVTVTGSDRRQAFLHRDRDLLPDFPIALGGDVEASPVLADLDGDNRNELVVANSDGLVHAFRRDGSELPGWPVRTDPLPYHPAGRAFSSGEVAVPHGAVIASPAVADLDRDGTLEVVVADLEGKVYVFDGQSGQRERVLRAEERYSGKPLRPFENVRGARPDGTFDERLAHLHRMQPGFLASPVLADIDRDPRGDLEIVAAAMDRHVYAWHANGEAVRGWPVVVVDRSKLIEGPQAIDPVTHRPFFDLAKVGNVLDQGAIIDTPAVGDLDGDRKPEIVVGTNESYAAGAGNEGPLNAGGLDQGLYEPLGSVLSLANGRVYAIRAGGDEDGDPNRGPDPWLAGWPFKIGILQAGVLPLVGEGVSGYPVIGELPCQGSATAPRVGVVPAAGLPYLLDASGKSCLGQVGGRDVPLKTYGAGVDDQPFLAAFGHPAIGELAGRAALLAPVAGLKRALDVVLPEYQAGQDYLAAWDVGSAQGTLAAGWPAAVNDLQFLTGPSLGDIASTPGEEVVSGTAHHDLQGLSASGQRLSGWPKVTGDWTVANPTIGTFGELETDPAARKVVIGGTRDGYLFAYRTAGAACAAASWPRFHHDPANSGDARRDAVPPGRPADPTFAGETLAFTAPGDDLLCGRPLRYEVRTDSRPITPASFAEARSLEFEGQVGAPGQRVTLRLASQPLRYLAVRAVDDQGNVGLPAVIDTRRGVEISPPPSGSGGTGGGASGTGGGTGDGAGDGAGSGRGAGGGGGQGAPGANRGRAVPAPAPRRRGRSARRCVGARATITKRGVGRFRLGATLASLQRTIGPPVARGERAASWCVRGGGRVDVVFAGRRGRALAIVTSARGHRFGRLRPGARYRARSAASARLRAFRITRRARVYALVRKGRVVAIAVGGSVYLPSR